MSSVTAAKATTDVNVDQLAINTIRTLSMDAVQQAKSGHPGTPMALARVWCMTISLLNKVSRTTT